MLDHSHPIQKKEKSALRILVTRPSPDGERLSQRIQLSGNLAIFAPTIAFGPPPNQTALLKTIQRLNQYDWVIFTSPQAARNTINIITQTWAVFPKHTHLATVGPGTAQLLKKAGYFVSAYPSFKHGSTHLLSLTSFQEVENVRFLIIKGKDGLNNLQKKLQERQAIVDTIDAYERILPKLLIKDSYPSQKIDVIIATSCDNINNLKQLLAPHHWKMMLQRPIIVVSLRMMQYAQATGFKKIYLAESASDEALLDCLHMNQKNMIEYQHQSLKNTNSVEQNF